MFINLIKQVRQIRRDGGALYTASTILHNYLPSYLFHARGFLIIVRELDDLSVHKNIVVTDARSATRNDLDLLSQCGYPQLILEQWFEQGARAWLTKQEGELLSCYWLDGKGSYALYDWLVIRSTKTDAWILWWWVNPNYRKRGLGDQVRLLGIAEYANAGFTHILSAIDVLNSNAVERANKLGLKTVGYVFILRVLGLQFVRFGRTWHIGRWTPDSPLEPTMKDLL